MKIALIHYHLSPGGVSTVMRAASHALAEASVPHVILTGATSQTDLPCEVVDGLGYLVNPAELNAETLLTRLREAAERTLGSPPDIWHFHNHSLGKNALIAQVVNRLAKDGERLVLQIHDLAEEGRPHNYPNIIGKGSLYPIAPHVHYAFINTRDRRVFIEAGLPESQGHFLPNPTSPFAPSSPPVEGPPLVLYPTRAIRRKNLGEILLLSLLAPVGTKFAITLAPKDPAAREIHDSWQRTADEYHLPIEFEVVNRLPANGTNDASYEAWVARATHLITTSIVEGFGLNFLESAAYGKPLVGRNLPHVTADHPSPIGTLYDRILVPADWIPADDLRDALLRDLTETYRLYQRPLTSEAIEQILAALSHGDHLDFGNLPESIQRQIISRIAIREDDLLIESQGIIRSGRYWFADALSQPAKSTDLSEYSIGPYGKKLTTLYAELMAQPRSPVEHLESRKILDSYLNAEQFRFLLTSPPASNSIHPSGSANIRAVIFDIYGTLLIAPPGGFKPDPLFDPTLTAIVKSFGHTAPAEPTLAIDHLIRHHHQTAPHRHPEIDLRTILQELLGTDSDLTAMVQAIEDARIHCEAMPAAMEILRSLATRDIRLGLLSNAQSNTLPMLDRTLDGILPLFDSDLTVLSYQHGIAKPSPELFRLLAERLARIGITPGETLYVGNDPLQDIVPANAAGFRTALFQGHPDSFRKGDCHPDVLLQGLPEILTTTSFS